MTSRISPHFIWLVAFCCSLFFINDWQVELFGAAIILVSVWAVLGLTQAIDNEGVKFPIAVCLYLMLAFWGVAFLSILGSDVINVSVMAFCFFSALPLTFLVFVITGTEKNYRFIFKVLAVIFSVMAVWAVVQFFIFSEMYDGRARHPLMNPNSLAALFSLGFFCALGGVLGAKDKKIKLILTGVTVLIMAGIVATGSRGVVFVLVPVTISFFVFALPSLQQNWKYLAVLGAVSIGLFLLSSLGLDKNDNLIARVVSTVQMNDRDISNNRFVLWQATIDMIKAHGVFGTGIGTYFLYFPEFRIPTDRWGTYYAHNDPLQFWVELGILGPVLFYAFIVTMFWRTVRAVKAAVTSNQKLMILTPFFALSACVIHTHVTFNFYNLSILFAVGFLLAVWFYATKVVLNTPVKVIRFKPKYNKQTRMAIIAFPFVLIVGIFTAYIVSEHYTNKARDHLLAGELEEFADDVLLANKISLQGNYRSYLLAVNVPMSLLQEAGDRMTPTQKREIVNQAAAYINHVRAINPQSASALYYQAKIQQLVPKNFIPEEWESAQIYYEKALSLEPLHIGARIELSKIYERDLLDRDRAIALLEVAATYRYASSKALDLYSRQAELYLKARDMDNVKVALKRRQNFAKFLEKRRQKTANLIWADQ